MKLHLLRHAKTDQHSASGKDYDRELLPKGKKQCLIMSEHLKHVHKIKEVWCSSAARTKETYKLINKETKLPDPKYFDDLYLCSKQVYLDKIWDNIDKGDLLIIGHNYGISDLASYLTDKHIELRTCGYICIEFETDNWNEISRGTGTIIDHFRPEVNH